MSDIPTYDYRVVGSDCLHLRIRLKDEADAVVDLTGFGAEIEIGWEGEQMLITSPALEIEAEQGTIAATLAGTVVATLPLGRIARHRWTLIEPGGCRKSVLQGFIERI